MIEIVNFFYEYCAHYCVKYGCSSEDVHVQTDKLRLKNHHSYSITKLHPPTFVFHKYIQYTDIFFLLFYYR